MASTRQLGSCGSSATVTKAIHSDAQSAGAALYRNRMPGGSGPEK
jgi:hypothetical protein